MAIKRIEDMDYYEILNLKKNASVQEIERAYHLGKSTYSHDSLAHYSLLSERERLFIVKKIEDAYQTLKDTEKRKLYNLKRIEKSSETEDKVYFRKSTQKLEIEDAEEKRSLCARIKYSFLRKRNKI